MVPLHPDIAKAEKVLAKYEVLLKSIKGVVYAQLGGNVQVGIAIEITAMNPPVAGLIRAVLATEIEGVKIVVGSPGRGALNPKKEK